MSNIAHIVEFVEQVIEPSEMAAIMREAHERWLQSMSIEEEPMTTKTLGDLFWLKEFAEVLAKK